MWLIWGLGTLLLLTYDPLVHARNSRQPLMEESESVPQQIYRSHHNHPHHHHHTDPHTHYHGLRLRTGRNRPPKRTSRHPSTVSFKKDKKRMGGGAGAGRQDGRFLLELAKELMGGTAGLVQAIKGTNILELAKSVFTTAGFVAQVQGQAIADTAHSIYKDITRKPDSGEEEEDIVIQ